MTQSYLWNGQTQNLLMDSTNAYIYAAGNAPAEQVNLATGAPVYLVTDSLGSVRGTVNSSGTLTGTTSYDAWGNPLTTGGLTSTTPFGYAGGYTDPDGLIYLVNRYYDPQTGQFLSLDPDVDQTLDPYSYTDGNPVSQKDPNGKCPTPKPCGGNDPNKVSSLRMQWALTYTWSTIKKALNSSDFKNMKFYLWCAAHWWSMTCTTQCPGCDFVADAATLFTGDVCTNCSWDASSPVRKYIDQFYREKYEWHWALRATKNEMVYETVFGNIAYSYIGRKGGWTADDLQTGGQIFDALHWADDAGNYIQRQMGIDLYRRHPYHATEKYIYDIIVFGLYNISGGPFGGKGLAHTPYACPYDAHSLHVAERGGKC